MASYLAGDYPIHVRVGAANAGHTLYVYDERQVVQQLPCAAYANPWAKVVLGAGALISENVLQTEIAENQRWRKRYDLPALNLYVDHRAHVVMPAHILREEGSDLAKSIGSTSALAKEGIGEAQAARVLRSGYELVGRGAWTEMRGVQICDTVSMLHDARDFGMSVLLEGTQGTGLSNTTGQYPYVTSRNVTASGLAADCGFGPRHIDEVILVCRTYPIRVAGNSGPFWHDSEEIDWHMIGVDPAQERTTVTKKVRRVATFSYDQVRYAARLNSATQIAMTHADQLCPEVRGVAGFMPADDVDSYDYIGPMIRRLEEENQIPVTMVATGPDTIIRRESPIEALARPA